MDINKIALIGISGSGKSTFSRKLSESTGLPVFHMDQLFWSGNWEEVPEPDYLVAHHKLIEKDKWIIEGYIDAKMTDRLKNADIVIFLDYPGWLCAWWVLKRWITHRKQSRPELPKEALERLKGEFLWRVLKRYERIPLIEALELSKPENLITVNSPQELDELKLQF